MSYKTSKKVFIISTICVIFGLLYFKDRKGDNMTINKNVEKVLWMFSVMFITYLLVGSFIVSRNILDIVYLVILYTSMIVIKFVNRS